MPSAEEMAAAGFTPEDFDGDIVEIWPENWSAFDLFSRLQTQWRVGMGGATGLDYNVLFRKMDRMRLNDDEYEQLEDDVRVLEAAALSEMNKKT